jgi:hypothetical protein
MWERLAADPSADYTKELRGATLGVVVSVVAALYFMSRGRFFIAAIFVGSLVTTVQAGRFAAGLAAVDR